MQYQAKDLFQLQTELVEAKIDMAASRAIERVLDRIDGLQNDMDKRFTSLDSRMVAVETKLGMVNDNQSEIRAQFNEAQTVITTKFIEYAYKAGWLILAAVGSGIIYSIFHMLSLR